MKLFGLDSCRDQAAALARALGVELARHEERDFEDREFKLRPLVDVRDEHVAVYHSLHTDAAGSSSDKLCRLLFFIGALKDASAARVTALVPYLAFARKDRRTKPRDPVTTRYVAQMFEAVGTDGIVTADVHNLAAFENAFRCEKLNLSAAPVLIDHLLGRLAGAERIVVVSPDAGGMKRARLVADALAERSDAPVDVGIMEKHRSEGRVTGELFAGDVGGTAVAIFDDLISSGGTMARAARACKERGATAVHLAATHGLFAASAGDVLASPDVDSIVVTDTAGDVRARVPDLGRLTVVSCAPLFAEALRGGVRTAPN